MEGLKKEMSDKEEEEKPMSRHEVVELLYTACARLDSYERPDWIVRGLTELAYRIGRGGAGFVEDVKEVGETFDSSDSSDLDLDSKKVIWDPIAPFVNLKGDSKGIDKAAQLQDELNKARLLIMFAIEMQDKLRAREKV